MDHRNRIYVIEGADGVGKSSLISMLADELEKRGVRALTARSPGVGVLGQTLRDLILDPALKMDVRTQALLHCAHHYHLISYYQERLASDEVLLVDRFDLSTRVYQPLLGYQQALNQGHSEKVANRVFRKINKLVMDSTMELRVNIAMEEARLRYIFLDADDQILGSRMEERSDSDRYACQGGWFQAMVRERFRSLACQSDILTYLSNTLDQQHAAARSLSAHIESSMT